MEKSSIDQDPTTLPEKSGTEYRQDNFYITAIREAIQTKNAETLKNVLTNIKDLIEAAGSVQCADISDSEIEQLIDTGKTTIYVATGTLGERMIFNNGKIYMSIDKFGKEYRDQFRHIFYLPYVGEETENPSVNIF